MDQYEDPEYDDTPQDECEHSEYSIDVLTGRAECDQCPHGWWASSEQIAAESRRQAEYAEWEAEQRRPWNRVKEWAQGWWQQRGWPRCGSSRASEIDNDIPF